MKECLVGHTKDVYCLSVRLLIQVSPCAALKGDLQSTVFLFRDLIPWWFSSRDDLYPNPWNLFTVRYSCVQRAPWEQL